jgi:hypothetical protein
MPTGLWTLAESLLSAPHLQCALETAQPSLVFAGVQQQRLLRRTQSEDVTDLPRSAMLVTAWRMVETRGVVYVLNEYRDSREQMQLSNGDNASALDFTTTSMCGEAIGCKRRCCECGCEALRAERLQVYLRHCA